MRDYAEPCTSATVELAYYKMQKEICTEECLSLSDTYEEFFLAASAAKSRLRNLYIRNFWDKIRDFFKQEISHEH